MNNYQKHILNINSSVSQALEKLNVLQSDAILIITDNNNQFLGSLTDGDIRRGLLKGLKIDQNISDFVKTNNFYINDENPDVLRLKEFRLKNIKIIPVLNQKNQVIDILNLRDNISYLPIDVMLLAGGKGERLKPLTDNIPKPLLKVGNKPIIEHNIDRLIKFGVNKISISVNYLAEKIIKELGDGSSKNIEINYISETKALGTIGSLSLIKEIKNNYILVANSDLLTNIDYEDFYLDCIEKQADFSVATVPYEVKIPYAVMETSNAKVISFKEKPTYTYYSNAGIYLIKKSLLNIIPQDSFYNATDFMEELIKQNYQVVSFPIRNYWLDIGKPEDFQKAQEDIKHISM